jgi:nucleoside 2-deoxyribosyltransferase
VKGKTIYLAGPMRGLPEYNFPAFHAAAADLRERGYEVWSPAEHDETEGFVPTTGEGLKTLREYMQTDIPQVLASDALVVLTGWEASTGARLEVHVAHACSIPVLRYPDLEPARHVNSQRFHELLQALGSLHDRKQADYGRDNDPFANVRGAEEWGVPAWVGAMVRATDKVRRLQTQAQRGSLANESALDAFDDLAVYALIGRVLFEENLPV